ncbi:hypothetical protein [Streptomyces sp. NPDC058620]|uniref:hypothetical protein n=1 Tax=Streptomyces sp. NPDC058620 TaxID=3346560 RepID=UPI003654320F
MNGPGHEVEGGQPKPPRRLWVPLAIVALVFCVGGAAVAGGLWWVTDRAESDLLAQEMNCCWEEGATPAWMSEQMGIRFPEQASDRRAGYKVGQRYDTGLLSFVLPSEEAQTYTDRLVPDDIKMSGNTLIKGKDYRPAATFTHLGLPEPETFIQDLRRTSLCPEGLDTPEGAQLQRCIDLFVHEYKPGTTRIYVRSTIEPSVTPPPAAGNGQ